MNACRNRGSVGLVVGGLIGWSLLVVGGVAQAAEKAKSAHLPLRRVVIFSSGVGFFEHAGKVEGNAAAELEFKVGDVNDLLKSMVVQDLDGGRISSVNYSSKDPVTRTLKTFAVDLTTEPTLAQLLGQVRGEKVEVEAGETVTGVILGIERKKRKVEKNDIITIDVLNLLTDEGFRAVSLENVSRVRLLNPKLDAELRKALALLAGSHATDKKKVELSLLGEGTRRVRVGYIQEAPVWKTTYRLVVSDKSAPFLQGWAIVENTSERDWSDVQLTLVSGRPISFAMDLYEPLYLPRPQVQPQLFASLHPQTYGQDLADRENLFARSAGQPVADVSVNGVTEWGLVSSEKLEKRQAVKGQSLGTTVSEAGGDGRRINHSFSLGFTRDLSRGVASAATAAEVGEAFQYAIDTPVTLPRQKSAMLPIVNANIKGEKVSIYNPRVHAKHPLAGLKLTNATKLHLMQGPITVFDGGAYAGDAQIEDMAPGASRLISYAMDLDTEVAPKNVGRPEELLSARLVKGVLIVTRKYTRSVEYTIKNSGRRAKNLLIEHSRDDDWKLVAPKKPAETARDRYRFALEAKPGTPAELKIEEERTIAQHLVLSNLNDDQIRVFLRAKVISRDVKDALAKILEMKRTLADVAAARARKETEVQAISREQDRIRSNMDRLDRASDLYKRYVKKLGVQEDAVEALNEQIIQMRDQESEVQKTLDKYLINLNIQ